jgi:hypothetical protein
MRHEETQQYGAPIRPQTGPGNPDHGPRIAITVTLLLIALAALPAVAAAQIASDPRLRIASFANPLRQMQDLKHVVFVLKEGVLSKDLSATNTLSSDGGR